MLCQQETSWFLSFAWWVVAFRTQRLACLAFDVAVWKLPFSIKAKRGRLPLCCLTFVPSLWLLNVSFIWGASSRHSLRSKGMAQLSHSAASPGNASIEQLQRDQKQVYHHLFSLILIKPSLSTASQKAPIVSTEISSLPNSFLLLPRFSIQSWHLLQTRSPQHWGL